MLFHGTNPTLMNVTHVVFRIGIGLLFFQHGLQKIFGLFGGRPVPLGSLMSVAGTLELVGGALLVVGLLTRPVAAVLTIEMLVAFTKAHLPRGGWPIQNGGELPLLFAAAFIFLAGHGAGAFSLDAWLRRRRSITARIGAVTRRAA